MTNLDMLGNEVKMNDEVVYVYPNSNGRTVALKGKIKGFNKKGCIIETNKGRFNVKNVIKLQKVKQVIEHKIEQKITLFGYILKKILK